MIVTDMMFELYLNHRIVISSFVIFPGLQDDANLALNLPGSLYTYVYVCTHTHVYEHFESSSRSPVKIKAPYVWSF